MQGANPCHAFLHNLSHNKGGEFLVNNTKFSIPKTFGQELVSYADDIAHSLASTASALLRDKFNYYVLEFYNDYTPKVYMRHNQNPSSDTTSGLYRIGHSGVEKAMDGWTGFFTYNTEDMENYGERNQMSAADVQYDVMRTFLAGYHGQYYHKIHVSANVRNGMLDYIDHLAINAQSIFIPDGKRFSGSGAYKYLRL